MAVASGQATVVCRRSFRGRGGVAAVAPAPAVPRDSKRKVEAAGASTRTKAAGRSQPDAFEGVKLWRAGVEGRTRGEPWHLRRCEAPSLQSALLPSTPRHPSPTHPPTHTQSQVAWGTSRLESVIVMVGNHHLLAAHRHVRRVCGSARAQVAGRAIGERWQGRVGASHGEVVAGWVLRKQGGTYT